MNAWRGGLWLVLLAASSGVRGQELFGEIRIWGSAQVADLATLWEKGFARVHPGIRFENHLYGAVSAIAGLYTGVADLAISREIWPTEALAFEQVIGYRPTWAEVATGSFDVPTKSDSLEVFVHKDNPLTQLTLPQLDGIFGAQHASVRDIRTWGDLGLTGEWKDRPIHAYSFDVDNAGGRFLRDIAMKTSAMWNCDIKTFGNGKAAAGQRIVDALAGDRYGIAVSNVHYARAEVKALALSAEDRGPFVAPARTTIQDRSYPLARVVYAFLNRAPHHEVEPRLAEFLRYILSEAGQRDIMSQGDYLPLPPRLAREQMRRIQ